MYAVALRSPFSGTLRPYRCRKSLTLHLKEFAYSGVPASQGTSGLLAFTTNCFSDAIFDSARLPMVVQRVVQHTVGEPLSLACYSAYVAVLTRHAKHSPELMRCRPTSDVGRVVHIDGFANRSGGGNINTCVFLKPGYCKQ